MSDKLTSYFKTVQPKPTIMFRKITATISLIILLVISSSCTNESKEIVSIVPLPTELILQGGSLELGPELFISFPESFSTQADLFSTQITAFTAITKVITENPDKPDLIFEIDPATGDPGSYNINIEGKQTIITAADESGLFYASQTLLQLFMQFSKDDGSLTIPKMEINDSPAFSWRGMHLDVSRHFFPVDFIKKYIDILAFYKMNVFHWHLTDDQGWRIEIKQYPELTEIGAFREDTRDREWTYNQFPVLYDKPVYGGFYTQEEVKDIIEYASERFVTIIPEIELPGHSWSALLAFPHLSCAGTPFFKDPDIPFEFTDPFCAGNEETFEFFENVLDEVIALFPSEYIHIGGDEAKKIPWEHCDKCQARIHSEGLSSVEELQSYFIGRIGEYVKSKDRAIIGWDEILEGGLAKNAAVMSWQGEEGGIEAARQHHPVVMTPGSFTYLSSNQDLSRSENSSVLTLEHVYSYNPMPAELSEEEKQYILGVQGCLWSENIQTPAEAEFQILPRVLALAETGWSKSEDKNFTHFLERLEKQFSMLDRLNYNYYIETPGGLRKNNAFVSEAVLELTNSLGFGDMYYTTNGTIPTSEDERYSKPVVLSDSVEIHASTILNSGRKSRVTTGSFIKVDPIPGVEGSLSEGLILNYSEGELSSLDQLNNLNHIKTETIAEIEIPGYTREDYYALVYSGFIKIEEVGVYTFVTNSDDGTRLFIHDDLLIDNDGVHGPVRVSGQVALSEGYHPFKLQYFEGNYGEVLELSVLKDETEIKPQFFHK